MSSPRVLANRYQLDLHAAEGGMGSVWRATDLQLERRVAVKLMSEAFAEHADARARFLREAKAAAKIQSPHVVATLDYGVDGTTPYIVMEWLDGESLGARLKREGPLSPSAVGTILRQVARGLLRAHELGVVHRDLKPDNLFLQRDHDEEIVKILDFGVAKAKGQVGDQTRTGLILGSLRYMSPEQARANRDIDHRSDLWSLGVIAYRCLSGELPFNGTSDGDLLVNICTEAPTPIAAHRPELGSLDGFFERCFAKDPAKRFGTASELTSAYFLALGLDDPSKRASSVDTARAPLPSYSLPAPAPLPPRALPPPSHPGQGQPPPVAAPTTGSLGRESLPSVPAASAPLAASSGPPPQLATESLAQPPEGAASRAVPLAPPSGSGSGPVPAFGPSLGADPASRSAILVASLLPAKRGLGKLPLAIAIGGGVGAALALLGLVLVLGSAGRSDPPRPSDAAAAPEHAEAPREEAKPASTPPREEPLAPSAPPGDAEPAASSLASADAPPADAPPADALPTDTAPPSASASAASSASAPSAPTSPPKGGGSKPLSRPLIPSNPY